MPNRLLTLLAGGLPGQIKRGNSGLNRWRKPKHPNHPHDADDFALAGMTSDVEDVDGNYTFTRTGASGSDWEVVYDTTDTDAADQFIQAMVTITDSDGSGLWVGAGLGNASAELAMVAIEVGAGDSDMHLITDVSGTQTTHDTALDLTPNKVEGTYYRVSFWSRPNGSNRDVDVYDFHWDQTLSATNIAAMTGDEVMGFGLLRDLQSTTGSVAEVFGGSTPFVTFEGLGPGSGRVVEVTTIDGGTVLGTATESGTGRVQISMMEIAIPDARKIRVLEGGELIAELVPASDPAFGVSGVMPGSTYILSLGNASISETTSGLLFRHVANDADDPFVAGDWNDDGTVPTQAATVNGMTGRLELPYNAGTSYGAWQYTPGTSRTERMIHARIQTNDSSGQHTGPSVYVDTAANHHAGATFSVDRGAGEILQIGDSNAGSWNQRASVVVTNKDDAIAYRIAAYANSDQLEGYDFDSDASLGPSTSTAITSGKGGIGGNPHGVVARTSEAYEYWEFASKNLTVTGMVTGYKAKIVDSSDTVLAEATEASGTATVDMLDVDPTLIDELIVTDDMDLVKARHSASVAYPGGAYVFAP